MRLNPNCDTFEEAFEYFKERTIQMYLDGYIIMHIERVSNLGVLATYFGDKEYHSFYLYSSKRGKGIYERLVNEYNWNIITSKDCGIDSYLRKKKIKYKMALGFNDYPEYQTIDEFYGKDTAERSQVPLMNHIDEGLAILKWIGSSQSAKRAYCLHPIYQNDKTLKDFGTRNMRSKNIFGMDANVITNAVEYRSVANEYLPGRKIGSIDEIRLSPLEDVNQMLIADKIQNRKDFELYHQDTHPRAKELHIYFKNWMEKLGISEKQYKDYKQRLIVETQII